MLWPDQRLKTLFGIDHPILQAPMAWTDTPALAAAVSGAGGLGGLGCGETPDAALRVLVAELRLRTGRPFNLNFFVYPEPATAPATLARTRDRLRPWYDRLGLGPVPELLAPRPMGFGADKLRLVLDLRPKVASFHFGTPEPQAVRALQAAGIRVIGSATSVAEARLLEAAGFDAVIAQGYEAGGHRGSHQPLAAGDGVGTLALVPQVVDAVRLPVIAAGGIGDGRGIAAALALGAAGVQMGTAFLLCPEAATPEARRVALRQASDTDTMVSNAFSGRAARTRRSAYALDMAKSGEALPDFPTLYDLSGPLMDAGTGEVAFDLWGQASPLAREIPAAEVVAGLVRDTQAVLSQLAGDKAG